MEVNSKLMDTHPSTLAPVGIISKALCSGYLAAAVFIHTTIERFFSKHSSPEEKKKRNHTSAARALLVTVVFLTPSLWHSLRSGHQKELKKGTKNKTLVKLQPQPAHSNLLPATGTCSLLHQCLITAKHCPSALDYYVSTKNLGFQVYSS